MLTSSCYNIYFVHEPPAMSTHLSTPHRFINKCRGHLCGNTDNAASWAGTSVASLLALCVATLAKVISTGVDNDGAAEDAVWADELDVLVFDRALAVALAVGLEVAQVSYVALAVLWGAVLLAVGVEVWACRSASIGVVSKRMNVHTTLGIGIVASDIVGDLGWATLGVLLEGHLTLDIAVTTENCDCFDHCGGVFVVCELMKRLVLVLHLLEL